MVAEKCSTVSSVLMVTQALTFHTSQLEHL